MSVAITQRPPCVAPHCPSLFMRSTGDLQALFCSALRTPLFLTNAGAVTRSMHRCGAILRNGAGGKTGEGGTEGHPQQKTATPKGGRLCAPESGQAGIRQLLIAYQKLWMMPTDRPHWLSPGATAVPSVPARSAATAGSAPVPRAYPSMRWAALSSLLAIA